MLQAYNMEKLLADMDICPQEREAMYEVEMEKKRKNKENCWMEEKNRT